MKVIRITRKKKYLKPWVKTTMSLLLGVFIIANIFSVFGAMAYNKEPKEKVIHGVITMNLNGESHIKQFDGRWEENIVIPMKDNYTPSEVVTVVYEGDRVDSHRLTAGKELKSVMNEYGFIIEEYRNKINSK